MSGKIIRVWDPLVRLFHWSLVVAFIVAWLSGEEESLVHVYAGYVILGLVGFRIVWGLVGPRYARFSNFLYSPDRTVRYLRSLLSQNPEHYTGHNPAGGWMIMLLLVSLLVAVYTGLEVYGAEGQGPLAGGSPGVELIATARANDDSDDEHDVENEAEEFWEELHEFSANLTLLLVFVHIAGVLVASYVHRENLVRAMINGRKRVSAEE
ncbi:MAG: cytochrome b/b6 domain-containing protein [Gammaproteobacteria bacterium]|nr:cytochrome b/b6 domain-containing protein [Gammaproteobacteria bacterium]